MYMKSGKRRRRGDLGKDVEHTISGISCRFFCAPLGPFKNRADSRGTAQTAAFDFGSQGTSCQAPPPACGATLLLSTPGPGLEAVTRMR